MFLRSRKWWESTLYSPVIIIDLLTLQMQANKLQQAQTQTLPRIYSHKKINQRYVIPQQAKPVEQETIQSANIRSRSQSVLQSNRKTLQSANSSKAVRLQVTTAAYHKKIQQLERQQVLLEKEIENVKSDVAKLRLKRKGVDDAVSTVSSVASSTIPEQGKNRIDAMRRRLDKQKERSKKVMGEVEKVRKDIQTKKKLNAQLAEQLQIWQKKYNEQMSLANQLQETMTLKNAEGQKKKIQMVHQKVKIIKQYDAILHKLDNQLNSQTSGKPNSADFYLTDIAINQQKTRKKPKILPQNSPKGYKSGNRVQYFRQKMQEWKEQSQAIKQKVNAGTLEQAEKKLVELHQNNYNYYKFLNQRHAALMQIRQRNSQLLEKRNSLKQEMEKSRNSHNYQNIATTKKNIKKTCEVQNDLKHKLTDIQKTFAQTKTFVCELIRQSGLVLDVQQGDVPLEQQITQSNLSLFLHSLLQKKQNGNKELPIHSE